uniref:SGL domain-containing protein n=1 Tax=Globodera pallida TaxID=36090 RepID=A0A183CR08_GLOPA
MILIVFYSYYFSGLKKGRQQIFVDNLPGFPDNIRLSSNGKSFFVALAFHRSEKSPHTFDKLGPWPFARKVLGELIKLLPDSFINYFYAGSVHGIILELDLNGVIVRSWHDPNGSVISHISEADDDGGEFLYLSSFVNNYIGRMSKK